MANPELNDLFIKGLRLLYGAHHQGAEQAASNATTATTPKLKRFLLLGSKQNLKQAKRLEQVFRLAGVSPIRRTDEGMQGISRANNDLLASTPVAFERDLLHIAYGQVAAHFYMAKYGTIRTYAEALGQRKAAKLLQKTLGETGMIDKKFTALAAEIIKKQRRGAKPGSSSMSASQWLLTAASIAGVAALTNQFAAKTGSVASDQ